jgi:hypothetical protein
LQTKRERFMELALRMHLSKSRGSSRVGEQAVCGCVVLMKSPSADQRRGREPGLRNNRMMSVGLESANCTGELSKVSKPTNWMGMRPGKCNGLMVGLVGAFPERGQCTDVVLDSTVPHDTSSAVCGSMEPCLCALSREWGLQPWRAHGFEKC